MKQGYKDHIITAAILLSHGRAFTYSWNGRKKHNSAALFHTVEPVVL